MYIGVPRVSGNCNPIVSGSSGRIITNNHHVGDSRGPRMLISGFFGV